MQNLFSVNVKYYYLFSDASELDSVKVKYDSWRQMLIATQFMTMHYFWMLFFWTLSVALRGSILYFVIVEMSMVNVMYQTSLKQFLELFDMSMARSPKSPITSKRINSIIEYLTLSVFQYTARGLYEIDKFLYTILMTLKLEMAAGRVKVEEFSVFIKGMLGLCIKFSGVGL